MSTDEIPMPFSVPQRSNSVGSYGLWTPPEYRIPGGMLTGSVPLPPGRSMITVTWDGAERIGFRVERKINGVWQAGAHVDVINAGTAGTSRTSAPISVVAAGVGEASVSIQTNTPQSQATLNVGAVASVDVITIPPPM